MDGVERRQVATFQHVSETQSPKRVPV